MGRPVVSVQPVCHSTSASAGSDLDEALEQAAEPEVGHRAERHHHPPDRSVGARRAAARGW